MSKFYDENHLDAFDLYLIRSALNGEICRVQYHLDVLNSCVDRDHLRIESLKQDLTELETCLGNVERLFEHERRLEAGEDD